MDWRLRMIRCRYFFYWAQLQSSLIFLAKMSVKPAAAEDFSPSAWRCDVFLYSHPRNVILNGWYFLFSSSRRNLSALQLCWFSFSFSPEESLGGNASLCPKLPHRVRSFPLGLFGFDCRDWLSDQRGLSLAWWKDIIICPPRVLSQFSGLSMPYSPSPNYKYR